MLSIQLYCTYLIKTFYLRFSYIEVIAGMRPLIFYLIMHFLMVGRGFSLGNKSGGTAFTVLQEKHALPLSNDLCVEYCRVD